MITFAGSNISGTHGAVETEPPESRVREIGYAGLDGVFEQRLGRGGRMISIHITIHGNYPNQSWLDVILDGIDRSVQIHGTLDITRAGSGTKHFPNCTFLGFFPDNAPDNRSGPLKDDAGTLDGGWWIQGMLQFRQLALD